MVFGLKLFSSASDDRSARSDATGSSSPGSTSSPGASYLETSGAAAALTTADSLPPDAAVSPPLSAIPPSLIEAFPALALTPYNLTHPERCANVLALAHNAARLEISDMCGDILPALEARAAGGCLIEEDLYDLKQWWAGFARFVCTTSLVTDMVVQKAFGDVFVGFRKETRGVQRLFDRVCEKNNVYLELAVKKMGRAVEDLSRTMTPIPSLHQVEQSQEQPAAEAVQAVVSAWSVLYQMLTEIYTMAEDMVLQIDRFGSDPLEYKDLERNVAKIYTQKKRWADRDEAKRGEMIVILTRWMTDEGFMRNWMATYLAKQDLRRANSWMNDYRSTRLVIVDRFHSKKVAAATNRPGASNFGGHPA